MYEFEYITDDGGTSYIDDRSFPICKGGVILAKPGQLRHTDLPYKCLYVRAVIEDGDLRLLLDSLPSFFMPPIRIASTLLFVLLSIRQSF